MLLSESFNSSLISKSSIIILTSTFSSLESVTSSVDADLEAVCKSINKSFIDTSSFLFSSDTLICSSSCGALLTLFCVPALNSLTSFFSKTFLPSILFSSFLFLLPTLLFSLVYDLLSTASYDCLYLSYLLSFALSEYGE